MEKKLSNLKLFLRNNGFYLALVLCLMAVGTGIVLLTVPHSEQEAEVTPTTAPVSQSLDQRLDEVRVIPERQKRSADPDAGRQDDVRNAESPCSGFGRDHFRLCDG